MYHHPSLFMNVLTSHLKLMPQLQVNVILLWNRHVIILAFLLVQHLIPVTHNIGHNLHALSDYKK